MAAQFIFEGEGGYSGCSLYLRGELFKNEPFPKQADCPFICSVQRFCNSSILRIAIEEHCRIEIVFRYHLNRLIRNAMIFPNQ